MRPTPLLLVVGTLALPGLAPLAAPRLASADPPAAAPEPRQLDPEGRLRLALALLSPPPGPADDPLAPARLAARLGPLLSARQAAQLAQDPDVGGRGGPRALRALLGRIGGRDVGLLATWARDAQADLAADAHQALLALLPYTSRERDVVAAAFLAPGAPPPPAAAALPPALVALVEHGLSPAAAAPPALSAWTLRWLAGQVPDPRDAALWVSWSERWLPLPAARGSARPPEPLLPDPPLPEPQVPEPGASWSRVLTRALGRLDDPASERRLRALARLDPGSAEVAWTAWSSLARRGDGPSADRLEALGSLGWRYLADARPAHAAQLLRSALKTAEGHDFRAALQAAAGDPGVVDEGAWLPLPPESLAGAEAALLEGPPDGMRLAVAAALLPALCTRGVLDRAFTRLRAAPPLAWASPSHGSHDLVPAALGLLEVADPVELRALLRAWAATAGPEAAELRALALRSLLALGDPLLRERPELVAAALPAGAELARLRLTLRLRAQGLPPETAEALLTALASPALTPPGREGLLGLLRQDRAAEAAARLVGQHGVTLELAGLVPGEAMRAALAALRDDRRRGAYDWATWQLALAGEARARAEALEGLRDDRPYTSEAPLSRRELSLDGDPEALRLLVEGAEHGLEAGARAALAVPGAWGADGGLDPEAFYAPAQTLGEALVERYRESGHRLRWSLIARDLVARPP